MSAAARPLVVALLFFLLGLVPGLRWAPAPALPAIAAALLLVAPLLLPAPGRWPRLGPATLWAAFVLAGLALGGAAAADAAGSCRARLADRASLRVQAVLGANSFSLHTDRALAPILPTQATAVWAGRDARLLGCEGPLRIRLPDDAGAWSAGSVLGLWGEWTRLPPPVAPSRWPQDPRSGGFLRVDSVVVIQPASLRAHPLLMLRGRTEAHVSGLFGDKGPLAEALLLGRRDNVDPRLRERFVHAGMAHLLAISGMHVGLIAGMMLLAGQSLARATRLSRRAPVWMAIGGIVVYLAMIGAPPSAVRAGIMICLALLGVLLQRPFSVFPVVAAAALAILAARPLTVLEPGFQLSFAGVLGILALRGPLMARLPERWSAEGWRRYLAETTVVSTAAFAATLPVVVWHFGTVAPVGLISNLIGIPVMSLALVGLVATAITGAVAPAAAGLLGLGTEAMFFLLDRIAAAAAAVPYGHAAVPRPQAGVWLAAGVVLLLTADAAGRLRSGVRWTAAVGAALVVFAAGPAVAALAGETRGSLELHFLDVGQGDAIAIRTPGDRWVLVDAGPAGDGWDAGRRRVLPFLHAAGARRIEALILTHPHLDHIGGAPAVLQALPVRALIEPGLVTASPAYLATLRAAEERGVAWRAARSGRVLELDGVRFELLWPDPETLDGARDANEISTVVRVRFGAFAALLTGDAYAAQEHQLVRRHGDALRAQVLKAGHHGSYTSTSASWLDAVRPELVVISAGRRNRFGHPAPEVLDALAARGIRVARTDRMGTVSVIVRGGRESRWYLANP